MLWRCENPLSTDQRGLQVLQRKAGPDEHSVSPLCALTLSLDASSRRVALHLALLIREQEVALFLFGTALMGRECRECFAQGCQLYIAGKVQTPAHQLLAKSASFAHRGPLSGR